MIVIFKEKSIYKYLRVSKKSLAKVFKIFSERDNLIIVIMVAKIQGFYSRMCTTNLDIKKMFLVTYNENDVVSVNDLQTAVEMFKGKGKQIKLVSDRESDRLAAEALNVSYIFLGKKSKKNQITTIKDISLLPNILGINSIITKTRG
ncbi:MAG: hypothetical protein WC249_01290 [Patescibacteria group bacterium]|jgi:hypothetical protein